MTSKIRRMRWLSVLVLILALALGGAQVLAINLDNATFELDGNAVNGVGPVTLGDDWDQVCRQVTTSDASLPDECLSAANLSGSVKAVSWAREPALNSTIFTGGGSKDPNDISQWAWKDQSGGLPDKDNLLHSFAARYSVAPSTNCTVPEGSPEGTTCELLVFGSDRYDNSGDAHQAFWFLQNEVGLGNTSSGGGFNFTGPDGSPASHKNGDVLIISNFSNGGTTSTILVYQWNSAVSGNLELLASSSAANCITAAVGADFCGLVNAANGTTAPWSFTNKSGNSTYLQGEFFEAALNLSELGLADQCFQTVVAETRSSTSTTATLKDFVLAPFGKCESETVTTPLVSVNGNDSAIGTSPLIGTTATVKDQAVITVEGVDSFGGTVTFFICSPAELVSQATCVTGGTQVGAVKTVSGSSGSATVISDAYTVTSPGKYCFRGVYSGDAEKGVPGSSDSSAGECFELINPTTTLNKSVAVEVKATYSYAETNDGSVPLTPPTAGNRSSIVSDPECTNNSGTIAYQSGDTNNNSVLDPGETWTLTCTATYTQPGTYTNVATGHGIDPTGADVTYCADPASPPDGVRCDQDEQDSNSVTVEVDQGK